MTKRIIQFCLALGVFSVLPYSSTSATTYVTEKFECPIGGEKFKADVVASNISFGQRPDGKPYSPLPVYPIVECPENGLLLIDENFTTDEISVLEAAIETPEYKAMRTADTQHFRASWLKKKLGRDTVSQISSLLQATWETDDDYERKIRYQSAFIEAATSMPRSDEVAEAWFWYNLRAVNALRELGYFSVARKHLGVVMAPENLPTDPEQVENGRFYADRLSALLADRNPYFEPANLVPKDVAIFRCVVPKSPLTPAEIEACSNDAIGAAISDFEYKPKGGKKLKGESAIRAADTELRTDP